MPIKIERLPGESIICATATEPFEPDRDIPAMFSEVIPLRMSIQGKVVQIIDLSLTLNNPDAFSQMVLALAEASRGIRANKEAGFAGPPIIIFVGSGLLASLASQAIGQAQYGGVTAQLCDTLDEALTVARAKLAE